MGQLGARVLPLASKKKGPPLFDSWPEAATTKPEQITAWWTRWPASNIGVATGKGSALVDVETDIKPHAVGEDSLSAWAEGAGVDIPETWSFRSGGGGIHRLFRCGHPDIPSRTGVLPAVDVRANGGYAVFPPSVHPSGGRYEWLPGHSPNDMPEGPAIIPFALFCLIMEDNRGKPVEVPEEIPEGTRNSTLFSLGCSMRATSFSEGAILAALMVTNEESCSPPLSDQEVETIARSAGRYERGALPMQDPTTASTPLDTITAADLQQKDLPPIKFIVDGLLSVGLNILASPPKYGKSWMVLDLGLAVASGGRFLGYMTNQCGCLYLALEDSQRRLKTRMNKLLAGKPAPAGFHFATTASPIDGGLFDELEDFLKKHPDTGLIVVDTLQRVRGAAHGKEGAYAADYREIGDLKAFADQHNVALLLVHHLRKMKDDGDPFNMISGTNGIMGAADTTMVLTKEKRGDSNATFSVVGRDVESSDTVLRFNKDTCSWENLGDADCVAQMQARRDYQESPIVKTIKKLLEQSPEGWSGTAQQLLEAGRSIVQCSLADSTQGLSKKLKSLEGLLFEYDKIVYERKRNGSGGGKHKFYSCVVPQLEKVEQTETGPFLGG